ncbi:MAG TPA: DoxX family protein [Pyrinomonadaceae bacterium]
MSQVLTNNSNVRAASAGRITNVVLCVLQVALALMFLMAGFSKLAGAEQMVGVYEQIGTGQWFRYVTGGVEVTSAVLLLVPRLCGLGALLVVATMTGAIFTHLFVIGGSPLIPSVLLFVAAVVAWGRRERTLSLLSSGS